MINMMSQGVIKPYKVKNNQNKYWTAPKSITLKYIQFLNWIPASMVRTFTLQDPSQLRLWSPKFPPVESQLRMSQGVLETGTLVGLWSDSKSGFSETKSPDPDPWESQKCLLGWVNLGIICLKYILRYKGSLPVTLEPCKGHFLHGLLVWLAVWGISTLKFCPHAKDNWIMNGLLKFCPHAKDNWIMNG